MWGCVLLYSRTAHPKIHHSDRGSQYAAGSFRYKGKSFKPQPIKTYEPLTQW